MKQFAFACLTAVAVAMTGCGDSEKPGGHDHADGHGHNHSAGHDHAHGPPHGGTPVIVADHKFHLELVRDTTGGKMLAYVLDGHMEKGVSVPETSFSLIAKFDGQEEKLEFARAANATNATSAFEARSDWVKTVAAFEGLIPSITLKGETFTNVSFSFPKGTQHTH